MNGDQFVGGRNVLDHTLQEQDLTSGWEYTKPDGRWNSISGTLSSYQSSIFCSIPRYCIVNNPLFLEARPATCGHISDCSTFWLFTSRYGAYRAFGETSAQAQCCGLSGDDEMQGAKEVCEFRVNAFFASQAPLRCLEMLSVYCIKKTAPALVSDSYSD